MRVATVRLILLTGCRPGEIRQLQWPEVKPDRLILTASKTGPRDVLLCEAARRLLAGLAMTPSEEWVLSENGGVEPIHRNTLYQLWAQLRAKAGIVSDARLHDLRHSHASHAIMDGESLHVTSRLLGHRRPSTTNRYAHLGDATLGRAAEQVAMEIACKLTPGSLKSNACECATHVARPRESSHRYPGHSDGPCNRRRSRRW